VSNPTDRNDNHKLKLPRAWKSSDSEQPWQNGEGKETHDGFHYGNQTMEKENGASSLQVGFSQFIYGGQCGEK
jgi:hypothetical protein